MYMYQTSRVIKFRGALGIFNVSVLNKINCVETKAGNLVMRF